jgi:tRNA(Arg) A34 adenosine deaminase TadA
VAEESAEEEETMTGAALTDADLAVLRRCVELARAALDAGDEPFGSVLVDAHGTPLAEDRNRAISVDPTRHPEFELARWAAQELSPPARAAATVYTSGEHCPMCSAAHAWVGIGRIVYAASSAQLIAWGQEWGAPPSPVAGLSASVVAPGVVVQGPALELADELRELHYRSLQRR